MKEYLDQHVGQKLQITRAGGPHEVHFQAVVKAVGESAVVLELEDGTEMALSLAHIIAVSPTPASAEERRHKPGFR